MTSWLSAPLSVTQPSRWETTIVPQTLNLGSVFGKTMASSPCSLKHAFTELNRAGTAVTYRHAGPGCVSGLDFWGDQKERRIANGQTTLPSPSLETPDKIWSLERAFSSRFEAVELHSARSQRQLQRESVGQPLRQGCPNLRVCRVFSEMCLSTIPCLHQPKIRRSAHLSPLTRTGTSERRNRFNKLNVVHLPISQEVESPLACGFASLERGKRLRTFLRNVGKRLREHKLRLTLHRKGSIEGRAFGFVANLHVCPLPPFRTAGFPHKRIKVRMWLWI